MRSGTTSSRGSPTEVLPPESLYRRRHSPAAHAAQSWARSLGKPISRTRRAETVWAELLSFLAFLELCGGTAIVERWKEGMWFGCPPRWDSDMPNCRTFAGDCSPGTPKDVTTMCKNAICAEHTCCKELGIDIYVLVIEKFMRVYVN